jgi:hypothetical protein
VPVGIWDRCLQRLRAEAEGKFSAGQNEKCFCHMFCHGELGSVALQNSFRDACRYTHVLGFQQLGKKVAELRIERLFRSSFLRVPRRSGNTLPYLLPESYLKATCRFGAGDELFAYLQPKVPACRGWPEFSPVFMRVLTT